MPLTDAQKLEGIFSGSGGLFGGPVNTVTTETQVPDWVNEAAQTSLATARSYAALPYVPYTGQTLAPFSPDQLAAFQAVRDMQGQASGDISAAIKSAVALPQTINALYNPNLGGLESDTFANSMRGLAVTREAIRANAARQGTLGGTREAVDLARAGSDAQRQLGSDISTMTNNAWLGATQDALSSLQTEGALATEQQTATLTDNAALYGIGAADQTQRQAAISDALQKWQAAQNYPYQQLAVTQSALAGSPYGATTISSQPYNRNPVASGIGMAASALGLAASIPGTLSAVGSLGSTLGMGSGLSTAMSGIAPYFAPIGIGSMVGGLVGGQTGQEVGTGVGALASLALLLLL